MYEKYTPLTFIRNLKEKGLVKSLAEDWKETSKSVKGLVILGTYATVGLGALAYLQGTDC